MGATATVVATRARAVQSLPGVRAQDGFAVVKGIKLHYHDWGGQGNVVLFLTGLGDTIDSFNLFAPRFADQFRVMGFTRRGQGDSDKPATGYDAKTLASDIVAFMDAMSLPRVILVGHSIAGIEMATAATMFPERIEKIVYLDSAYDYGRGQQLSRVAGVPPDSRDPSLAAISKGAGEAAYPYANVPVPSLAFFVSYKTPPISPDAPESANRVSQVFFDNGYWTEQAERFRKEVPRGHVVILSDTNHFFFRDPKYIDGVAAEMRRFLATP